jgi:predicted glycoside hydrolase/deacetylase ChbG (UPF0249 family)
VASLVDEAGRFYGESAFIARLNSINPSEVEAEWRTQVNKFVAIAGHAPDHLDSHHHVSFFAPELFEVMLKLAQEYRCAIRLPVGETAAEVLGGLPEDQANRMLAAFPSLLGQYQPRHPDRFVVSFYDETASEEKLRAIVSSLSDGVTEIMCHPAYPDSALFQVSRYTHMREVEFGLLTRPSLLQYIQENHVELVNFGRLS